VKILLTLLLTTLLLTSAGAAKKPNFLFVIVDDQSPLDLKIYNPRSILDTPNVDRLAQEGMVLDGAHHMGAWVGGVCTPSRHMVMSGRTVWHVPDKSGRVMNPHVTNPKMVPPDLAQYTLPAVFNRAGYHAYLQERQQLRCRQQALHGTA
jgi:choline-sulfatase